MYTCIYILFNESTIKTRGHNRYDGANKLYSVLENETTKGVNDYVSVTPSVVGQNKNKVKVFCVFKL